MYVCVHVFMSVCACVCVKLCKKRAIDAHGPKTRDSTLVEDSQASTVNFGGEPFPTLESGNNM